MKYIFLLFLSLILSACDNASQQWDITDATKPHRLLLKSNADLNANVHAIKIKAMGYVKGDATLTLILDEEPYLTKTVQGNFSVNWDNDWYSNEATIIYTPSNVAEGQFSLSYQFLAL